MSYDLFVQRFEHGDARPMSGEAFLATFEPHIDRRDPRHRYGHLSADDGGTADIYPAVAGDRLDCLMISRCSAGVVLDLLVTFIRLADAVVLATGCPTLLAHEGQRHHLPDELRVASVVVQAGVDVERVLRNCR